MLLYWPKRITMDSGRGRVLSKPVELRDVLPTFLDAAGDAAKHHLDGDSLLKLVRGETSGWREFIDMEHDVCYSVKNHLNALTDGRWKYIFHAFDGSEQLFDLSDDPNEINDLSSNPSHSGTLQLWRERLARHLSERGDGWVTNGRPLRRPRRRLYSPHYPGK